LLGSCGADLKFVFKLAVDGWQFTQISFEIQNSMPRPAGPRLNLYLHDPEQPDPALGLSSG
jgi:hypothetical protein